ncbi:hypothetical protein SKAU_G00097850 [Synaphobranchus kaupii]|uniref:Uncharacterized protein n=1 Tax=Synaphobranchus kaupii TaxID=118154 RepID=A0A9Q1FYI8_SYNKA|nr:hypothetical protein SKAU_G00097850 [Synaphobranchus kaupii]
MRKTEHLLVHKVVPERLYKLPQKITMRLLLQLKGQERACGVAVHQPHKHPGIRHGKPRQLLMWLHQCRGSSLHGHLECN